MANLAVVCPPLPGHLNPMAVLGRRLQARGHRVTVFHIPALEGAVRAEGLDFHPVGTAQSATLSANIEQMSRLRGLQSVKFAVECSRQISELLCSELPKALETANIDLVLADQNEPAAGTAAELLRVPFINVCPSLPLNRELGVPPPFLPWSYRPGTLIQLRNWMGYRISDRLIAPINQTINGYRRAWELPLIRKPDDSFSKSAQFCQMPREFDFPRRNLPAEFHYLGPFVDAPRKPVPFPFEKLDGRPLIYASLGTLQEKDSCYFDAIADACAGQGVQLVMSLGGAGRRIERKLAGNPLVVEYAPQLDLLARATLTITHAGLNTVMQSLLFGVPMVAIPVAHDQPAIAARVAQSGVGETISLKRLNSVLLRRSVERVLKNDGYRQHAQRLRGAIRTAGGVEAAATLTEDVLARRGSPENALRNH